MLHHTTPNHSAYAKDSGDSTIEGAYGSFHFCDSNEYEQKKRGVEALYISSYSIVLFLIVLLMLQVLAIVLLRGLMVLFSFVL